MGPLSGQELRAVVGLFEQRGVSFYHACQLKDFLSYLELGGVPSRGLLERTGRQFTGFKTDEIDRLSGVWTLVFGNLSDFGLPFALFQWKKGPIPNPYGPILLVMKPAVLLAARDVSICLRSAGAKGFDRHAESLSTSAEVDRLFAHTIAEAPGEYAKAHIKFSDELKREFCTRFPKTAIHSGSFNPELSSTVDSELLPFSALDRIVVDPYRVNERDLLDRVNTAIRACSLTASVVPRLYKEGRFEILNELAIAIAGGVTLTDLDVLAQGEQFSQGTREWAQLVRSNGLAWQFERFACYLREGTLSVL